MGMYDDLFGLLEDGAKEVRIKFSKYNTGIITVIVTNFDGSFYEMFYDGNWKFCDTHVNGYENVHGLGYDGN